MNYRLLVLLGCIVLLLNDCKATNKPKPDENTFFAADNPRIQYIGRIDFSDSKKPRFWQPGVYITVKFTGTSCTIIVNDEMLWGSSHNYIDVVVDGKRTRIQTTGKTDTIVVAAGLAQGTHSLVICKDTEAGIGYLEFVGLLCKGIVPPDPKPTRKIEFIGNSITCGSSIDESVIPCGKGKWYDQHNAYMSYGPLTARQLNAQWQISAVSGIGLIHSCCDMKITMPQVYNKINMRTDTIAWNFTQYQPDVVTVCLGQNDGIQDSVTFCNAYISFLQQLRNHYPGSQIVCETSPMGSEKLNNALKNYITAVVLFVNSHGDKKVTSYFYYKKYRNNGCGTHPGWEDHQEIAEELTTYLKKLMHW